MKTVRVAAAAILRSGRVLLCQRGYGELKGLWEFPGGKLEEGEEAREAAVREIREELGVSVIPGRLLCHVSFAYPSFLLEMDVFLASIASGEIVLNEHEGLLWADRAGLAGVAFCPADVEAARKLKSLPEEEWMTLSRP